MPSALLVDDAPSDKGIRRELAKNQPSLRMVGTVASVAEALAFVEATSPDFVCMRWELAGKLEAAALDFLSRRCRVVFVSPHGAYLVQRMRSGMPIPRPEPEPIAEPAAEQPGDPHSWIPLTHHGLGTSTVAVEAVRRVDNPNQVEMVPLDEILWIEAAQNYTKVHKTGDTPGALFHRSMADWERLLPSRNFHRISRSLIVRVPSIAMLTCRGRDDTHVGFTDSNKQLQIGRTAALRLKARFRHSY